jgi:hypothetical protein
MQPNTLKSRKYKGKIYVKNIRKNSCRIRNSIRIRKKNHSRSTTLSDPYLSLIIWKYWIFFWNFFEALIISKDPDPDVDPEDQLIKDSPDPDPKHWSTRNHKSIGQTSEFSRVRRWGGGEDTKSEIEFCILIWVQRWIGPGGSLPECTFLWFSQGSSFLVVILYTVHVLTFLPEL